MSATGRDRAVGGLCGLASAALGIACALMPLLFTRNPYFRDDAQVCFVPTFLAIGHAVRHGVWPAFTLQSWLGGNLLAEYQYGIANPASLLVDAAASGFDDMIRASVFIVAVYDAILCAGAYALARNLGASRPWSLLAALTIVGNNFSYYWLAGTWLPGLVSLAWLVWALAQLVRAHASRAAWLGAAALSALVFSAGWYFGDLALLLFAAIEGSIGVARRDPRFAAPVLAVAAAGLLTLVLVLPGIATAAAATRDLGTGASSFLVPNLYAVLAVSSPDYLGLMLNFGGQNEVAAPIFLAGWYILPLAPFVAWSRVDRRRASTLAMAGFALVLLLATQGPGQIGPVRWPFRYLPYFQIALVMLFAVGASEGGFAPASRRRLGLALLLVGLSALAALQAHPESWARLCLLSILEGGAVAYFSRFPDSRFAMTLAVSAALLVMTRAWHPVNRNVPEWTVAPRVTSYAPLASVPRSYAAYLGTMFEPDLGRQSAANLGLVHGTAELNGYSPIGQRGLVRTLCIEDAEGDVCDRGGAALLDRDPDTGLTVAALMRIDRLIIQKGPQLESVVPRLGDAWRMAEETSSSVVFVRDDPASALPGSVSWASPGLAVREEIPASAAAERIEVDAAPGAGRRIVFARLAWPGYRATWNGAALPVLAYRDIFVAVDLPDAAPKGTLVLDHEIPGWPAGVAAMIAAVVLGGAVMTWFGRFRDPEDDPASPRIGRRGPAQSR